MLSEIAMYLNSVADKVSQSRQSPVTGVYFCRDGEILERHLHFGNVQPYTVSFEGTKSINQTRRDTFGEPTKICLAVN